VDDTIKGAGHLARPFHAVDRENLLVSVVPVISVPRFSPPAALAEQVALVVSLADPAAAAVAIVVAYSIRADAAANTLVPIAASRAARGVLIATLPITAAATGSGVPIPVPPAAIAAPLIVPVLFPLTPIADLGTALTLLAT
jgi:hypothetical protein